MGLISNTGPYNAAADKFGVVEGSNVLLGIPRQKFNFSVDFIINESVSLMDESFGRAFTFDRVSSVGLPDFDYNVVKLNQYNRPRFIPTRLDTQPVSIIFYDTKDNQFNFLLMSYAQHYFNGHSLPDEIFSGYSTTTADFSSGAGHDFGAKSVPQTQRFFFEEIIIKQQDTPQGGRAIHLYNCMMTSVNHDRLDYSDSQPVTYNVQFQPEHVNIKPLGVTSDQAAQAQIAEGGAEATAVANRMLAGNQGASTQAPAPAATNSPEAQGLRPFQGSYRPEAGERLRNINGKTYVVPGT